MSEYRKQAAFLKTLMALCEDSPHQRALCSRLASAETSERCLLCACRLVGMIALLAMAGVGYSAVLLPEFFDNTTHVVIRFFTALGLGSALCFAVFLGLWFWYRSAANRVHQECRKVILSTLMPQTKATLSHVHPILLADIELKVTPLPGNISSSVADILRLPKAS